MVLNNRDIIYRSGLDL